MYDLFDILGKKSSVSIIRMFLKKPTQEFYETQVRERTKLAKASVDKWLKELEKCGFLASRKQGRMNVYRLNASNEIVRLMKIIRTLDILHHEMDGIRDCQAYLFGSSASGKDTESSDIDVLVIGKDRSVIDKIRRIDSRIKVSFFTPVEWSMAARKDAAFFESVEKNKIRLV